MAGVRKPSRNEPAVGGARGACALIMGIRLMRKLVMLAVLSFNAADDVSAGAQQHAMMIAMVGEHADYG